MELLSPIVLSIEVAAAATSVSFILGLYIAKQVVKLRRMKAFVDGILTLPLVLPPTVVGFFLLLIFGRNGLLGNMLAAMQVSVVFTLTGAIIAATVVSFPLMYRSARGAFEQFDRELIYAGRTIGMSEARIFWRVIMPGCKPGIISGLVLTFARALGEFGATIMLAGNIPGKTQTMSLAIYSAVAGGNREKSYMWVVVIMLISFACMLLMNLFSARTRKTAAGGTVTI
ncbi:MAG: molybdate ABC transporter permease subunit [Clostridiales Family XIII bacterium]|jgi:molybdate transport system permease protein|nr:molybdate ABC transporter permease subunit [Clostridiales Family XIII bacterium]